MVDPQSNPTATAVAAANSPRCQPWDRSRANETATAVATAISPRCQPWVEFEEANPEATGVATAISPRCQPWVEFEEANRSPGRGGSESHESRCAWFVRPVSNRNACFPNANSRVPSHGNRCRPYRGWLGVVGGVSHGSRRGLIAIAPTGAETRNVALEVLNSEAGELEERIANNVAKLLEETI